MATILTVTWLATRRICNAPVHASSLLISEILSCLQQDLRKISLSDLKKNVRGTVCLSHQRFAGRAPGRGRSHLAMACIWYVSRSRQKASCPALTEVQEQVRREYLDAKRREATDKFYEALLSRYTVKVEPAEATENWHWCTDAASRLTLLLPMFIGVVPAPVFGP